MKIFVVFVKIALVVLLGGLIFLAQIDRSVATYPSLANLVPVGFGGNADMTRATSLLQRDPAKSLTLTSNSLGARPFSAERLSLLAQTAIELNQVDLSSKALGLAAGRGWRDPYTQLTVLASAYDAGQYGEAFRRLEALARGQREEQGLILATGLLVSSKRGRDALASYLAESPNFSNYVLSAGRQQPGLRSEFAMVIAKGQSLGVNFQCEKLGDFASRLLASGETEAAAAIWRQDCGETEFNDFAFTLASSIDPYGWQFGQDSKISVIAGSEKGTIDVKNRDPISQKIGHKFARLAAGVHRLTIKSAGNPGLNSVGIASIAPHLYCGSWVDGERITVIKVSDDSYIFEVRTGCATQLLSLQMRQGTRQGLSVGID